MSEQENGEPENLSRFASEFPRRLEAALGGARGVVCGIEAAAVNGDNGAGLLDAGSLRVYHEIYRLRIEVELEAAAVLWRAAEATWSLIDAIEAIDRTLQGGRAAVPADSVAERRSVLPRRPTPLDPAEAELVEPEARPDALGADPHPAHRVWSDALAEQRSPRRRRFRSRRRGRAKASA
ncbi:MAG: hypothetical protein ACRDL6_06485 [Solirubrobacterales bacterium]